MCKQDVFIFNFLRIGLILSKVAYLMPLELLNGIRVIHQLYIFSETSFNLRIHIHSYSSSDWFEKHNKELAGNLPTSSNTLCEGNIWQLCFIHMCNFCQRCFICFSNSCIVCKTLRLRQVPIGGKRGGRGGCKQ